MLVLILQTKIIDCSIGSQPASWLETIHGRRERIEYSASNIVLYTAIYYDRIPQHSIA